MSNMNEELLGNIHKTLEKLRQEVKATFANFQAQIDGVVQRVNALDPRIGLDAISDKSNYVSFGEVVHMYDVHYNTLKRIADRGIIQSPIKINGAPRYYTKEMFLDVETTLKTLGFVIKDREQYPICRAVDQLKEERAHRDVVKKHL